MGRFGQTDTPQKALFKGYLHISHARLFAPTLEQTKQNKIWQKTFFHFSLPHHHLSQIPSDGICPHQTRFIWCIMRHFSPRPCKVIPRTSQNFSNTNKTSRNITTTRQREQPLAHTLKEHSPPRFFFGGWTRVKSLGIWDGLWGRSARGVGVVLWEKKSSPNDQHVKQKFFTSPLPSRNHPFFELFTKNSRPAQHSETPPAMCRGGRVVAVGHVCLRETVAMGRCKVKCSLKKWKKMFVSFLSPCRLRVDQCSLNG